MENLSNPVTYGHYTFRYNYTYEEVEWIKAGTVISSIEMSIKTWENEPDRMSFLQDWMSMVALMAASVM